MRTVAVVLLSLATSAAFAPAQWRASAPATASARPRVAPLRMSDEVDLASAEYDQAFLHRMRDREKGLLKKIAKALKRIEEGEYGECESCGNYIGYKRLTARPEADLCIECKEEQEMLESKFHKEREMEQRFPFK